MRILVWGINYAPEITGIAPCNVALCEFLRANGHEVHMLTTFRYYPEWQKAPADTGRLYRTDLMNDVPVHRCWHYVPGRVSALKRMIHEGTFVLTSFWRALTLPRPDVAIIVSPPLLLGAAGWLLGRLRGGPFIFHVQDLQPDAAVGLGMLKQNTFTRLLYRLEAFAYAKATRVSGISQGMLRAFAAKGVPKEKSVYFPNGVQAAADARLPPPGSWRERQGFGARDFLAVYAGNLGMKQGLEILLDAARLVRDTRVQIVICGQGAARERLLAGIEELRLPNLHLLPLQDEAAYREMMADTDLCLITQQAGTGQYFFPSKLLTALAFAKPVLAVADADSELAHAMAQGGFGFQVATGEPQTLADALTRAAKLAPAELAALGEAGRIFGGQFATDRVLAEFVRVIQTVAGS